MMGESLISRECDSDEDKFIIFEEEKSSDEEEDMPQTDQHPKSAATTKVSISS